VGWVEELPYKEFREWMVFYRMEPFGEYRMDLRMALMTANLISPHLKRGVNVKLEDFMLKFRPKRQSLEEMRTVLQGLCDGSR
jgi:hypothetical protein